MFQPHGSLSIHHLILAIGLFGAAIPGQEAEAIKAFKRTFKPSAKELALGKKVSSVRTDSPQYQSELQRQSELAAGWITAVRGLRGHASAPVAKLVAAAWLKVDKEVKPLWGQHARFTKRIDKAYAKVLKLNDGKPIEPRKKYPMNIVSAQQQWLMSCRYQSEVRREITELTTLHDELRQVVEAMDKPDGLTWLLQSVVGQKKYALALKVAAVRAAANLSEPLLADMTTALQKTKAPDVIAALLYGIAILGEKASGTAEVILPLLSHEDSGVREQAALALQHMKVGAAIEPMIKLIAGESGRTRKRIVGALEVLTGQQHGVNIGAWQRWFAKEGADYVAGKKPLGVGKPSEHAKFNKENYYYGIPQEGKGIIYVIDCSGSMIVDKDDPKWDDPQNLRDPHAASDPSNSRSEASKRELVKALKGLSSDKTFNIIKYNHKATLYKKSMVQATPKNVEAALEYVRKLPADSSTNIYEAMKLAFTLTGRGSYDSHYKVEFDTIFLLTDGKPTLQGVGDDDPMKIVEGVRKWNALKRVVVHTIAMGDSGIDHDFMLKLATENGGEYRKFLKGGKIVAGGKAEKKPTGAK